MDAIIWFAQGLWSGLAAPFRLVANAGALLEAGTPQIVLGLVHYGASVELFFLFLNLFLAVFIAGTLSHAFLWRVVTGLEAFANAVGRTAAWAGLVLVLQQVVVVFLQSVFRVSEISLGPLGIEFSQTVGWWSDSLKLYNAIVVTMCCAWTFVQRGHVRVDLVYAGRSHRTKCAIDMFGAVAFMMPAMILTWFYGWFFLWRHLINPPVNATDTLERTLAKAPAFRWNVETFGFSPSGFNAYFLFKVLILVFALMMLIQAVAVFYRAYLEFTEGERSAGRFHDPDVIETGDVELAAPDHLARKEG